MPEANMNRFADLVKDTVRLRDVDGVGLPDFLEVPATVTELMDIWVELVSVWQTVSYRDPTTDVLEVVPIADRVGRVLGARADAITEVWQALNAVVRRTENLVIDEVVLIDQLIALGHRSAQATHDIWAGLAPSSMRDNGLDVSRQLRTRLGPVL